MSEIENKEVEYLKKKISEVSYSSERFKLHFGEDKFIFGVISPKGEEAPFAKLMQYKTIYNTLIDLDWKLKISFKKAIKYSYCKPVQEDFSIVYVSSEEEKLAYYYIENALFRTSSLWDMLAQLYCLFYNVEIPKNVIYYNRIFNPNSENNNKFKEKAKTINNYLQEKDDISIDGEWKGNHKFANECRNKMTHRNSPNITVISDYDFNFKDHPSFLLKRIIEDYGVVSKYIGEILDEIENEIINNIK